MKIKIFHTEHYESALQCNFTLYFFLSKSPHQTSLTLHGLQKEITSRKQIKMSYNPNSRHGKLTETPNLFELSGNQKHYKIDNKLGKNS